MSVLLAKKQKIVTSDPILNDSPELLKLLKELKSAIIAIREIINPILTSVRSGELVTRDGVSFLDVKSHLLLNYCLNLCLLCLLKAEGKSLCDHPVIKQLVYIRVVLTHLTSIDKKMKYQLEKLLKLAVVNKEKIEKIDPLSFKPRAKDFVSKTKKKREDESEKYVPPKIYGTELEDKYMKREKIERRKAILRKSSLTKQLRRDILDLPEEVSVDGGGFKATPKIDAEEKFRTKFEEDNFVRLQTPKRLKKQRNAKKAINPFDAFENFEDFRPMLDPDGKQRRKRNKNKQVRFAEEEEQPKIPKWQQDMKQVRVKKKRMRDTW